MASTINADNGVSSGSAGLKSTADSSGVLSLQTNGTTAVTVDTSQNVGIGTSSPAYKFDVQGGRSVLSANSEAFALGLRYNTSTNGVWLGSPSANAFQISSFGGGAYLNIDSSGNLLVGTTGITSTRLAAQSAGSTSATYAAQWINSASTGLFYVRSDGIISTGTAANSPYNFTTGAAANMYIDAGGVLYRSTSSLKYKTDVQDATHGLADVLKLRPVTYKGKNDGDKVFGGLIAEEVHEAGLTEFVQYAKDGSPDALHYGNMVSLCIKAIQELKAEVDSLKSQLAAKG